MAGELSDILERLEVAVAPLQGEPRELAGGLTNRNYRVTLGGSDYVVRRPGKVGEAVLHERHHGSLSHRTLFEASIPLLPVYKPRRPFSISSNPCS